MNLANPGILLVVFGLVIFVHTQSCKCGAYRLQALRRSEWRLTDRNVNTKVKAMLTSPFTMRLTFPYVSHSVFTLSLIPMVHSQLRFFNCRNSRVLADPASVCYTNIAWIAFALGLVSILVLTKAMREPPKTMSWSHTGERLEVGQWHMFRRILAVLFLHLTGSATVLPLSMVFCAHWFLWVWSSQIWKRREVEICWYATVAIVSAMAVMGKEYDVVVLMVVWLGALLMAGYMVWIIYDERRDMLHSAMSVKPVEEEGRIDFFKKGRANPLMVQKSEVLGDAAIGADTSVPPIVVVESSSSSLPNETVSSPPSEPPQEPSSPALSTRSAKRPPPPPPSKRSRVESTALLASQVSTVSHHTSSDAMRPLVPESPVKVQGNISEDLGRPRSRASMASQEWLSVLATDPQDSLRPSTAVNAPPPPAPPPPPMTPLTHASSRSHSKIEVPPSPTPARQPAVSGAAAIRTGLDANVVKDWEKKKNGAGLAGESASQSMGSSPPPPPPPPPAPGSRPSGPIQGSKPVNETQPPPKAPEPSSSHAHSNVMAAIRAGGFKLKPTKSSQQLSNETRDAPPSGLGGLQGALARAMQSRRSQWRRSSGASGNSVLGDSWADS